MAERRYTLHLSNGMQRVWVGDFDNAFDAQIDTSAPDALGALIDSHPTVLLQLASGGYVNLAHVVLIDDEGPADEPQ